MKKAFKILGIFILLIASFIYTNNVFKIAKKKDPIMKAVISYKKQNDTKDIKEEIKGDEISLGKSGSQVDEEESYNNMKNGFDKKKIVYKKKATKINLKYYVNSKKTDDKVISLILRVYEDASLLKDFTYENVSVFVDGSYLENSMDDALILSKKYSLYNAGYNRRYDENINKYNNLLKSISSNSNKYCLNENKIEVYKKMCDKNKMVSIKPYLINPNLSDLKKNLKPGIIIMYDIEKLDDTKLNIILSVIKSKGYKVLKLDDLLN